MMICLLCVVSLSLCDIFMVDQSEEIRGLFSQAVRRCPKCIYIFKILTVFGVESGDYKMQMLQSIAN